MIGLSLTKSYNETITSVETIKIYISKSEVKLNSPFSSEQINIMFVLIKIIASQSL